MGDLLDWIYREQYLSDENSDLRAKLACAEADRDDAIAAKAKAEAEAAAMRESARAGWTRARTAATTFGVGHEMHIADRALAEIESATAGAALLRELEAGRVLVAFIRESVSIGPRLAHALAQWDAARGAK